MIFAEESIAAIADEAVEAIVRDLTDRRGLRQTWDEIDDGIRDEIIGKWKKLVAQSVRSVIKP